MSKLSVVEELVTKAYQKTSQDFGRWIWEYHVPVVAAKAAELCKEFSADADIAVAGAWLHDFGDAFVLRFATNHEQITTEKATEVLQTAGYSRQQIREVLEDVIATHSCKADRMPQTLEAKVLATADALAHLTTDFYLQFAWKHLPEGKTYTEFRKWVTEKIDRDFRSKIQFEDIQDEMIGRYLSLRDVFAVR